MTKFKVGDWVVRNPKHCEEAYWEEYWNTPVQVTKVTDAPGQELQVNVFPSNWWAGELFSLYTLDKPNLEDWL